MAAGVFASLAALLVVLFLWSRKAKVLGPLPPGPKPVLVLGNIFDLTAKQLWLRATEWAHEFGDVCYIHVLGQGLVFLGSTEATMALLDKRGSIYSDKPHLVMAGELCGCENMVAFTQYGDQSKRQRKLMQRALGVQNVRTYQPLLELETRAFLRRLLADPPGDYTAHLRRYAGGTTLLVVYGYEVKSSEDKFLVLAEECVSLLSNHIASAGGIWPVDIFHSLKHIPTWFPGAAFKRNAILWKAKMEEFVDKPYEFAKATIQDGVAVPSFCSILLDQDPKALDAQTEFDIKWTANSMYAASMDTMMTAMSHFLLAMVLHPEILAKAQKEIDSVVGNDRLPDFNDRPSLPYIDCIFSECLRWGAPVPLNLPHRLMEDDYYRGMYIPKGTIIIGNIWAISRDETVYPEPHTFSPERFLEAVDEETAKRRDPRNFVFGFGRRRCPGANLAESSLWLLMAAMMSTLSISKALDDFGNVIEPKIEFNDSFFRIPSPFKFDIRPRSEQALHVVLHQADAMDAM